MQDGYQFAQAWHPIHTAPKDKVMWVWHRKGDYCLAWFHSGRGRWVLKGDENYDGPDNLDLTAWHPLPEPPPAYLK